MKSPFYFIIKPINDKRYDNTKNIGGIDFITSTSQEDHTVSNRFAEVIETPINYDGPICKGDTLLVHHNVFKYYYDMKGKQRSSTNYFKDDLFFVDEQRFFMYKSNDEWKAYGKYCFVKPSEKEDYYISSHGTEQPLIGYIKYSNDELNSLGVFDGDKVSFKPDTEYEFNIDGEKLYRMFTNDITLLWTQTKSNQE